MAEAGSSQEAYSWHDNLIYGLRLDCAEPDAGLWHSRLVLDIDHIVEWICRPDGHARFRVAAATLVFHDVTDLRIHVDFGNTGHRQAINELAIDRFTREPVTVESAVGPFAYDRWRISLNVPKGGEIVFGASGYDLTLRAEPQEVDQPRLSPRDRPGLIPD